MHFVTVNGCRLEVVKGDITKEDVDAIVNAANEALTPGGGVSGAIHRAAGPGLWEECRKVAPCPTGEARMTKGHSLRARHVIHTVGPIFENRPTDAMQLASCYENCLRLAVKNDLRSIAFPAISTGIYGYPVEDATAIALTTVWDFLAANGKPPLARLVLFSDESYEVHVRKLTKLSES
jgi:O-acetyl-ADP-ribose deacetylase (regulator of RNase III)